MMTHQAFSICQQHTEEEREIRTNEDLVRVVSKANFRLRAAISAGLSTGVGDKQHAYPV